MKLRRFIEYLTSPSVSLAVLVLSAVSQVSAAPTQPIHTTTPDPPAVRQTIIKAGLLQKNNQFEAAVSLLRSALVTYQTSASLHFELGNALLESKENEPAIAEYRAALTLRPKFPEASLNIAYAYANNGNNADAVMWFERFIKENPKSTKLPKVQAQMLVAAATECLEEQRAFEAKKLLEHAILVDPLESHAHFKLARAYDELGNTTKAIEEYQQVLKLQPKNSAAVFNIAGCYQSMGRSDLAIAWFQKYLQNNPGASDATTVSNMIEKLKEAQKEPMLDPRNVDFYESVTDHFKCYRWPRESLPIKVFIQDGTGVKGYRPSFAVALRDAATAWSQATQHRILFFQTTNPNEADIVCSWTGDPHAVHDNSVDVEQGVCNLVSAERDGEGYIRIVHADIRILTIDRESQKPISDDDMKKTCLHELGHALGLHGHSTNNHDIMFFSVSPTVWPVLSKRDKSTLLRIYGAYPPISGY